MALLLAGDAWALRVNDEAPVFALRDSTDCNFYLSDFVGPKKKKPVKAVLISFFASYCKPCRHELPVLNSLVDEFGKKGVKIVVVGFKEDFDKIMDLLSAIKVDKPVVLSDRYGKVGEKYGVRSLPMTFLVGADGRVKDVIMGEMPDVEQFLRERINRALK